MTTFTIDAENNITAYPTANEAEAAVGAGTQPFTRQEQLAELAGSWPTERLVEIWNSLPGVTPVKGFKSAKVAASRIWQRIQSLGEVARPAPEPVGPTKRKAPQKAKSSAQAAQRAHTKGKAAKKASPAKEAPETKKTATAQASAAPREGTKTAQVVTLLQRKNGATLSEIMEKMGWQKHTVRGFMAGAMKKAGYSVESFKPDGGERTYKITK